MLEAEYKVALLGDGGVGKTSLVKKYVYNKFDEKYLKTLGTTVSKKDLILNADGEKVRAKLIIWDIMGQNIFPKVIKSYLRNTGGVIFVCDLTNKASFINLLEWIRLVFENTEDVAFVFLANKCDLQQEAFDYDEFELLANIYGSPYFKTSAKTGENVENTFTLLADQIFNKKFITNRILPQEGEPVEIPDKILAEDEIITHFCEVAGGFQVSMPVIREQFTKAGVNFENPTREGLQRVVDNLVSYMSFLSGEKAAKDLEKKLSKVLREREF